MKEEKIVIGNPAAYMEKKYGGSYTAAEKFFPWKDCASFCTTGQFENLEGGLMRHCGPTAVTNLILTLQNAGKLLKGWKKGSISHNYIQDTVEQGKREEEVFRKVMGLGKRRKLYWNTNVLGRFGGTFDLMSGSYIRSALREFGMAAVQKPRLVLKPSAEKAVRALREGSVLYLMLHKDPTYGSHHVLCYGYTVVEKEETAEKKIFLLIADGWANRTRYIPADRLKHSIWFEVK
ncbi:MAG: hypothetical protein U0L49_02050 [Eubacterium sp.]|nr:hypothetical protein [Eubacterium sp.]